MESENRTKVINDLLLYSAVVIALVVFVLSSFPTSTIQITQNQILLLVIVLVLLIFRHFTKIEIPGFLRLSKEVENIKKENEEIKVKLSSISISQAASNAKASFQFNQYFAEQAKEAKEVGSMFPSTPLEQQAEVPSQDFSSLEKQLERGQLVPVFAVIRNTLEGLLTNILQAHGDRKEYRSLGQLASAALNSQIIDPRIYDAINIIRNSSNLIIHSHENESAISIIEAKSIFDLAKKTVLELKKIEVELTSPAK
jgi:hypothetical protein